MYEKGFHAYIKMMFFLCHESLNLSLSLADKKEKSLFILKLLNRPNCDYKRLKANKKGLYSLALVNDLEAILV